ncbi:hypothetical protein B0H10DRAFT_161625 [Mycena sp. CBHHK59/15]|nr:hypothetical protein B0H10DRAFT_161625 [Mycena sp. CBHHK59/15]
MCNICPNSKFIALSKAQSHEDTDVHVAKVRILDRPQNMSSPLRSRDSAHQRSFENLSGQANDSGTDSESHSRSNSPGRFGLPRFSSPFLVGQPTSIHGPALPTDQICDNFAGELAYNRQDFDDSSEFEADDMWGFEPYLGPDEYTVDDQQVLGDSFTHSDDLLMQHDPRLSEQQKQFAPDVPLKVTSKSDWWCWRSKEECLLDIMSSFPRSCFSEKELNATRWYT